MGQITDHTMTLEKLRVAANMQVSKALMEAVGIQGLELVANDLGDRLAYQLSGYVLAERLPPVELSDWTIVPWEVPANWWQQWKLDHAGSRDPLTRWVIHRWPARMVQQSRKVTLSVSLERYRSYPKATYILPEREWGRPVLIHTLTHDWDMGGIWEEV